MKYCLKCARQIGDEHSFCPYCGSSQKWEKNIESEKKSSETSSKLPIIVGLVIAMMIVSVIIAFIEKSNIEKSNYSYKTTQTRVQEKSFSSPVISVSAKQILSDFNSNEVRAGDQYNGKRVRISGCAASIDNMMGILSVYINSCGGDFDIDYVYARFPDNARSKLAGLNKNQKIVVECTINDGGDIMGVFADNCILK